MSINIFRLIKTILLLLFISLVYCCASLPPPNAGQTFDENSPVLFEGMEYEVRSLLITKLPSKKLEIFRRIGIEQGLVVAVKIVNTNKEPLDFPFKPEFWLLDIAENKFAPTCVPDKDDLSLKLLQPINPNVPIEGVLVFNVPPGEYKLRIMSPLIAKLGFAGSINKVGHYIDIKLSPQNKSIIPK